MMINKLYFFIDIKSLFLVSKKWVKWIYGRDKTSNWYPKNILCIFFPEKYFYFLMKKITVLLINIIICIKIKKILKNKIGKGCKKGVKKVIIAVMKLFIFLKILK